MGGDANSGTSGDAASTEETTQATGPRRVNGWFTDTSKASIDIDELIQGQTKDGIPAISQPKFLSVTKVDFLKDQEPVIAFQHAG